MTRITLLFLLALPFSVWAQDEAKIDHLDFPYNLHYELRLKGTDTLYNHKTGEVEDTKNSAINYIIDKQTIDKKGNLTNFHFIQIDSYDSIKGNAPLVLDKKGMQFWTDSTDAGIKEKHKTQAILLPLYKGKKWNTYINDKKAVATCFTTSAIVVTPCGTFDAFGVETKLVMEQNSTYQLVYDVQEFYNQKVGKIETISHTYVSFTGSNRVLDLSKDVDKVVYYSGYKAE